MKSNQLKATPASRMLTNNLTNSSPAQRDHRNPSVMFKSQCTHSKLACLLLHIPVASVAEWSYACPAFKDCRDFKTSVCLWLLRAWVRIPSVVIISDNERLIQIVTLCLLFLKDYRYICAFMLLEQLASLSDDWSMLQKSSCFYLKKLNHISTVYK